MGMALVREKSVSASKASTLLLVIFAAVAVFGIPTESSAKPRGKAYKWFATQSRTRKNSYRRRYHKPAPQRRQVAMSFRKATPPMMVTYFTQPAAGEEAVGGGSVPKVSDGLRPRRSGPSLFLGLGFLGTVVRDSAQIPGGPRLAYGGVNIAGVWQPGTEWLVRFGLGYVSRTFGPAQDPSGGNGQVGQYWMGNLAIEYEFLNSGGFRLSGGWSNLLSYGYRSRNYLSGPTFGKASYLKTGFSTAGRYEVSSGVDLYAEGQWLFGIGSPGESQGTLGIGVLFGLD